MKRFKRRYNFKMFGFHFVGTISTYRFGWKQKRKIEAEQVEEPTLSGKDLPERLSR